MSELGTNNYKQFRYQLSGPTCIIWTKSLGPVFFSDGSIMDKMVVLSSVRAFLELKSIFYLFSLSQIIIYTFFNLFNLFDLFSCFFFLLSFQFIFSFSHLFFFNLFGQFQFYFQSFSLSICKFDSIYNSRTTPNTWASFPFCNCRYNDIFSLQEMFSRAARNCEKR